MTATRARLLHHDLQELLQIYGSKMHRNPRLLKLKLSLSLAHDQAREMPEFASTVNNNS
jgi:hypothetical protein